MIEQWAKPTMRKMGLVSRVGMAWGRAASPNGIHGPASGGTYTPAAGRASVSSWANHGSSGEVVHIHVGTLIANDAGLDELERRMNNRKRIKKRDRRDIHSPNGQDR